MCAQEHISLRFLRTRARTRTHTHTHTHTHKHTFSYIQHAQGSPQDVNSSTTPNPSCTMRAFVNFDGHTPFCWSHDLILCVLFPTTVSFFSCFMPFFELEILHFHTEFHQQQCEEIMVATCLWAAFHKSRVEPEK